MKSRTSLTLMLPFVAALGLVATLMAPFAWCQIATEGPRLSSERLLPDQTAFFLRIKTGGFWSPSTKALLAKRIATGDTLEALLEDILDPQPLANVDELLIVTLPPAPVVAQAGEEEEPGASTAMVMVTTTEPFDRKQRLAAIQKALAEQGELEFQEQRVGSHTYYRSTLGMESVAFLSDRQYLRGDAEPIIAALSQLDASLKPSEPSPRRKLWIDTLASTEQLAGGFDSGNSEMAQEALAPLTTPVYGAFRVGLGEDTTASVQITFPQPPNPAQFAAKVNQWAAEEFGFELTDWKSTGPLETLKREMIQAASPPTALMQAVESGAAGIQVRQLQLEGATWRCSVRIPLSEKEALAAAADAAAMAAEAVIDSIAGLRFFFFSEPTDERPELAAELKRIAVGLQAYHKQHGRYPPPAIVDKDGSPLLSWRVALLPFIGEADLYARFHLDEPWDSAHNLAVWRDAQQRTSVYRTGASGRTALRIFQGMNTPFPVDPKPIADDPSSTILIVQAGRQAFWTQPEALQLSPGAPLPDLGSATVEAKEPAPTRRIVHAITADGSIWRLTLDLEKRADAAWIRSAATANGGETITAPSGERLKVALTAREPLTAEGDAPPAVPAPPPAAPAPPAVPPPPAPAP